MGGGGFKDEGPVSKLTFSGGYTYVDQSNPKDPVGTGATTNGGYVIAPNNNPFTTDRIVQFIWAGAKYEVGPWSFTGAYYRQVQNSFQVGTSVCTAGGASKSNCAGDYDQGSFVVDYQFNKYVDIYSGVTYGKANDGLASGFPGTPGVPANSGAKSGTNTSVDTAVFMSGYAYAVLKLTGCQRRSALADSLDKSITSQVSPRAILHRIALFLH